MVKPTIALIGDRTTIAVAETIFPIFRDNAEFMTVNSLPELEPSRIKELEKAADIILTGPSTKRILSSQTHVPVICVRPTFPDMIRAILEAKEIDNRIALSISEEERNTDFSLLSRIMDVSLSVSFCDTMQAYEEACEAAKKENFKVIVGGKYTAKIAQRVGIRGILLYRGKDMIMAAIRSAIDLYRMQQEGVKRTDQLRAIVDNFAEGLMLTDETGKVILCNHQTESYLGTETVVGKNVGDLLHSQVVSEVLKSGVENRNVVEKENLVVDYIPIGSPGITYGSLCTLRRVEEVQHAEFVVRKKLHDRGFRAKYALRDIVGNSPAISQCKQRAALFARVKSSVLITGESGTGKELFANSIHLLSELSSGPFVAINCATLPAELLESELFGYEKGAFTGAHASGKKGLIELAHRGTLFLDEVTSMSNSLQAKLLRLLSEREILKVGSDRIIPVDIRVLAATNADIESLVADGSFREDLYYRLNVFRLHIPPLRERPDDLVPLFVYFVNKIRKEIVALLDGQEQVIRGVLVKESFKGNVREFENVAHRFCLLFSPGEDEGRIAELLESCLEHKDAKSSSGRTYLDLKTALEVREREILQDVLKQYGNRSDVARILKVDGSTLWRKLKKYDIQA